VAQEVLEGALLLLSPIIPHIVDELWGELRPGTKWLDQSWPAVDANALVQDTVELVVQVNGKLRGHIQVPSNASKEEIERLALECEAVRKFVGDQKVRKVIVVPGRLVNVVV
jgi:leucyl-tRNA synthetase